MDRATRRIIGCFIGQRDALDVYGLWHSLQTPDLDPVCHTDRLGASKSVVFVALHRIGETPHIVRFNATLRAHLAHLVRHSLSFSRKQFNLETVLWLFLHRSHAS
ncbi:MAG: hypothetical protein AB1511_05100 [Deinococcota bacterium]